MGSSREDIVAEARRMAEEIVRPLGLEVVEVVFRRQGRHSLLRIDLDRPGLPGVRLEECERVSRDLEILLDRAELVSGSYDLQVSSPGIERPIRSDDDYRRNAGRRVVVDTSEPIDGRERFRGFLEGLDGDSVAIHEEAGDVRIPRRLVTSAKQDADADLHAAGRGTGAGDRWERHGILRKPTS